MPDVIAVVVAALLLRGTRRPACVRSRELMRTVIFSVVAVLSTAMSASAGIQSSDGNFLVGHAERDPWQLDWITIARSQSATPPSALAFASAFGGVQDTQPVHAAAIVHSSAYETRAKIHKYASVATLPLFAAEIALGQSLFNASTPAGSKRGLHAAVGAGIIGLFALNTVTGSWNLFGEGWQEKEGRTLRLVHGLLMMAADAGFVGTWATGPHSGRLRTALTFEHDKMVHRNIALAAIGIGTAGYLVMFVANHF
jgi:hypothetical protein